MFSLNDLAALYASHAVHDPRIKQFVEKVAEQVQTGQSAPVHNFQLHELVETEFGTARLAVIAIDSE